MKRLKLLILVFCVAVSLPLALLIRQSFEGLAQEERSQLRFFSQTLLDEVENNLAEWVRKEENREVDEYQHTLADGPLAGLSPLSELPKESYILGYFQNNPDGSFDTPLVADLKRVPGEKADIVNQLRAVNSVFNRKKLELAENIVRLPEPPVEAPKMEAEKKEKDGFADRYLAITKEKAAKSYLGQKEKRTEEITASQAMNLSKEDKSLLSGSDAMLEKEQTVMASRGDLKKGVSVPQSVDAEARLRVETKPSAAPMAQVPAPAGVGPAPSRNRFEIEVAPLQSVSIGEGRFFIFRRVAIRNQIFRQGFVLKVQPYLNYLAAVHFNSQPMARFTSLSFQVIENGQRTEVVKSGAPVSESAFITQRTFPAPFDFLSAVVRAETLPASPARRTLTTALAVLGGILLIGLFAIYRSARAVIELSERRSQFVSSVTHELKTPLTNIRMYIEMLEQGIAATPEREQDYFRILGSESARLSRLINNVLELAKLEKKQRRFDLRAGNLQEELTEVRTVMAHKLAQEGFTLTIDVPEDLRFAYDREVMIQVLINLIENSIKFGRTESRREIKITASRRGEWVDIAVSDTGPGIPKKALAKVFDDFYRVDNELTRSTGGTGIGLALVKKFISTLSGEVRAANNSGPGCTITLSLPLARRDDATTG